MVDKTKGGYVIYEWPLKEDQLHLIHERFQELNMKFELFQKQPTVEYEPRLARVARQLRDIKEKVWLFSQIFP